ncbi:flagellar basal body-associated protein FliL [Klenkia sp. PcliD-1-E]|uniref:flagellar basal body-associated FliL family protein n=1 Tax=Klenkia sp. PcliD-1-E TaxID=2954492 RepID=UPI002097CA53|nr:flagellar basal body-associated FliL family protein [Klenkia sp. PcliD-1-E]MCO7221735.1 flagellar basal body-associated FliL family protein [Klenkia sp. PcliD-1-E]
MTAPTKERPVAAADTKGTKGKAAPEDGEEKKGGKLKLVVIAVVALLGIGAGLYFFVFKSSDSAPPAPVPGIVLPLDSVTVNLAGGGYLKIGVSLQLTEEAGETAPDGSKATDIVIDMFSEAQPTDVTGNRDAMKAELQQRIEDAYNTEEAGDLVMGIYYTEYVTQ